MATTAPARNSPADVPEHPKLYWVLWFGGWTIVIALLLVGLATWNVTLFDQYGITFNGGPTAFLAALSFLALSYKGVNADEMAGAFCYGKALVRLVSGPHIVWFLLMQVITAPREVQEFQCPDEPEKVFKGDDKESLPPGMVRPIRVVTRAPKPGVEATEILDTQMSIVINIVFQYVITDIFDFVANFRGSIEVAQRQMRDVGETTVAEDATTKTTAGFLRSLPRINVALAQKVQGRFKNSGVTVTSARLIAPDITHTVSQELANIPIARAKAEQKIVTAAAEEIVRTREGAGTANAKLALLTAEAKGGKAIKDALGVDDGNAVLAAEAVRGILDKTDVLMLGQGGMSDAMGLVKAAQSVLKSNGTTPTKGAKP